MAPLSKQGRQATCLILTAIRNLKLDGGATLKHISNYIKDKYPTCHSSESNLKKAIDRAIEFGALEKNRNKYTLGSILKHIVQSKRRRKREGKSRRRRRRRH